MGKPLLVCLLEAPMTEILAGITPHGPEADAAASQLVMRAMAALKARKLLPIEAIGHYLSGSYGRSEGWVAREQLVWVPYSTPQLVVLLPDDFDAEAEAAQAAIDRVLAELCAQVGYSLEVLVETPAGLRAPELALTAYDFQHARRLLWSFNGQDPYRSDEAIAPSLLAAQAMPLLVQLSERLADLAALHAHAPNAFQPGIVRLVFIRSIEALIQLGDAVLLRHGAMVPSLARRAQAMVGLAESGWVQGQLAALYRAAIRLHLAKADPMIPTWSELGALGHEIETWSRHVAEAHFGAERQSPAA